MLDLCCLFYIQWLLGLLPTPPLIWHLLNFPAGSHVQRNSLLTVLQQSLACQTGWCWPLTSHLLWSFNRSKPSGHYMHGQLNIQQFYVLPTRCTYVFCVDLRKNSHYFLILHWLTGFFSRNMVFTARYGLNLRTMYINLPKPSGHLMYHQFNIQQFYVLSTQCVSVCVDLKKKTAIIFFYSINWLVFITEAEFVHCAVRTGFTCNVY